MKKFSDNCCPIPRVPIYSYYTADVFSDRIFGGNPLAVFPEASGLTRTQMQKIAAEFNFSETVFVFPPETPKALKKSVSLPPVPNYPLLVILPSARPIF
jgi:trans-2,3-dihydro-3-hydroxyanthranilate isomerase